MSYNKSLELRITELSASRERMEIKKMIGASDSSSMEICFVAFIKII
jgi:hypothetical protein